MNNDLLKYIGEYFKTFPKEDYTICVNGTPTEWCSLNNNNYCVVYKLPPNSSIPGGIVYDREWYSIYDWEISEVSITVTTMTIKKKNGKEYTFIAKVKAKEEKAKNLILKVKNSLYSHKIDTALNYLDELNALIDE